MTYAANDNLLRKHSKRIDKRDRVSQLGQPIAMGSSGFFPERTPPGALDVPEHP